MDKKSQHVGNHGGVYTDMDGNTKQFTYVDHDVHQSRLKIWKHSDHKLPEPTENEKFCLSIIYSGISAEPEFIKAFDEYMEGTGNMRYRRGTVVEISSLLKEDDEWIAGLKTIFQTCVKNKIKELKSYI